MPLATTPSGIPHAPGLARFARRLSNGQVLTYRDQCAIDFVHGSTEALRYDGLEKLAFCTWPHLYLDDFRAERDGTVLWSPSRNWNPWLRRILRGFVNEEHAVRQGDTVFRFIGLTGVASAGKTYCTGLYSLLWWAVDPANSIVVQTSTTKDMIRSRIWSNIHKHWSESLDFQSGTMWQPGHMVDSMMKLHAQKGDAKHSISAYAVAGGETKDAVHNLKGMHAPRMLVVIDECNGTPEAIFEVIANYRKGCRDLTIIAIGNPSQHLDPHGRLCKPADGWPLAMDDTNITWRTEGVPDWQVDSGLCLRFDGRDSPNVRLKQNFYPHIYSYDDWRNATALVDQHGGTFNYWVFDRGMWPPDGLASTVFTEQLFIRCAALDEHFSFVNERESVAFMDTAFGGDACIIQFGEVGNTQDGRRCLQLTESMEVPIDPTSQNHDRDYQVARRFIEECKRRHIKPQNAGLDATGTGRGVASMVASEWSTDIHYIVWSQGCTERPSSQADGRPAREVYSNYVAEEWFSLREGVEARQVKGFSRDAVQQLCARFFELAGRKFKLETKADMKARLRYSPDTADAVVGLWAIARKVGLSIEGQIISTMHKEWLAGAKESSNMVVYIPPEKGDGWAEVSLDYAETNDRVEVWAPDGIGF